MTPRIDWAGLAPDAASPVPRYHQLAERIADLVRDGTLPPGAQLPPERDLAQMTGMSRMTARQALAHLARDGVVTIRHGVGAFVAEPKLTFAGSDLVGFTDEAGRAGEVATRTLEQSVVTPPAPAAALLDLAPGEQAVRIVRLRLSGGVPLLLQISFLSAARFPGLAEEDLERQSLYTLLALRHGVRLGSASQTVEATVAGPYQRRLLGLPEHAPLLVLDGIARDVDGRPVEAFRAAYRADRVKLSLETRGGAGERSGQQVSVVVATAPGRNETTRGGIA